MKRIKNCISLPNPSKYKRRSFGPSLRDTQARSRLGMIKRLMPPTTAPLLPRRPPVAPIPLRILLAS